MAKAEILQELKVEDEEATACLVKMGNDYYVVSTIGAAIDNGLSETLIFKSDKTAMPTSMDPVAGGTGLTRDEAIKELEEGKCTGVKGYESEEEFLEMIGSRFGSFENYVKVVASKYNRNNGKGGPLN